MISADYGYEKTVSGGVTTLRIKRSRSAIIALVWMATVGMSLVIGLVCTQMNNGHGTSPGVPLLICGGLFGIAILCSLGRSQTSIAMAPDRLTLREGEYAKRDIRNILICAPGAQVVNASSSLELQGKIAMRQAVASQSHYVTFLYGARTVVLADKMTDGQAAAVGSEVATWLAA